MGLNVAKTILNFLKLKFKWILFGSICLKKFLFCFCHFFLLKYAKSVLFFFGPFSSDFADSMSIISKTTTWWVMIFFNLSNVCLKRYMMRMAPKIIFVGFWSLILSRTSSPHSWKLWKYHPNRTLFHPWVNHEWTLNKSRISSWTLWVSGSCQAKNIRKNVWPPVFYLTVTLPELDS